MPIPKEILYLTETDVQKTMTVTEAVDLAEKGIRADGEGNVNGDKFYMNVGETNIQPPSLVQSQNIRNNFACVPSFHACKLLPIAKSVETIEIADSMDE